MSCYVYILASARNGTLYVGSTTNLIQRIYQHKSKLIKGFTSKYNVDQLMYFEEYQNIVDMAHREKRMVRHESAFLLAAVSAAEKILTQYISYLALGRLQ